MAEIQNQPVRSRDAQRTREIILDAAQAAFAEHGYDGARIQAIARASGYNISLLFQYFTDKTGLYAAVLQRADQELNALLEKILAPWLSNTETILDAQGFQAFLQALVRTTFDYMVEHPHLLRIITWEMAEGWSSYLAVASYGGSASMGGGASAFTAGESEPVKTLFRTAMDAGLLRSDFFPMIQLTLVLNLCQSYCASLPLYRMILSGEDIASPSSLALAREYLTKLVVAGMMADPSLRSTPAKRIEKKEINHD
ncbi:MAG TPA: TetR/AcrR family transcriptional regulator [Anaerolineaceae bacterium]